MIQADNHSPCPRLAQKLFDLVAKFMRYQESSSLPIKIISSLAFTSLCVWVTLFSTLSSFYVVLNLFLSYYPWNFWSITDSWLIGTSRQSCVFVAYIALVNIGSEAVSRCIHSVNESLTQACLSSLSHSLCPQPMPVLLIFQFIPPITRRESRCAGNWPLLVSKHLEALYKVRELPFLSIEFHIDVPFDAADARDESEKHRIYTRAHEELERRHWEMPPLADFLRILPSDGRFVQLILNNRCEKIRGENCQ